MKKIALAAAALLVAAGSAYARNDNVGSSAVDNQATVNVDNTRTSSVPNTSSPVYKLLNSSGDVAIASKCWSEKPDPLYWRFLPANRPGASASRCSPARRAR